MDSMTRMSIFLCLATTATVLGFPQPQRSIQLGGTGPRPVALNGPVQPGPAFSQQLNFGPPQQQQQQQQFQYQPQQQFIQQQQEQPQPQRVRGTPQPQTYQQSPHPQPILQGRGAQGTSTFAPIGSFPVPASPRQPILLRSPQQQQQVQSTTAASGEDEYSDEDEEQIQQFRAQPQPIPTPRPQQQRNVQRAPVRITQQQQPTYNTQPQRFLVPQQQQPQAQQRRPAQAQRVLQEAPAQQQQRLIQQAPVQQTYQPRPQPQHQLGVRLGQDQRLNADKDRAVTPAPVQTVDRYMRTNEDGSTSWGYTNEDGTFKEETLGVDCVVRGKYGYVDPDGVKREYEYQSGNPCDPNKKGQPEEDEEEEVIVRGRPNTLEGQQRLSGLLNARPVQYQPQSQQQQQLIQRQRQQYVQQQ